MWLLHCVLVHIHSYFMKDDYIYIIINHIKIYYCYDTETSMPNSELLGATCVQKSDDSRNSAIRTAYRTSLRSSSIWEPRYPSLKIFIIFCYFHKKILYLFILKFTTAYILSYFHIIKMLLVVDRCIYQMFVV